MKSVVAFIAICFLASNAGAISWDSLKVTFGIVVPTTYTNVSARGANSNGLLSDVYVKHPRTLSEQSSSWAKLNPGAECSGSFNGFQYYDTSKPLAIVLLYDRLGSIAGLQSFVPKSEALPQTGSVFRYDLVPMFNNVTQGGIDYFVVTLYFVDPTTICSTGRNPTDPNFQTGTGLWVQNGTSAAFAEQAPSTRPADDDEAAATGYSNNNCGSSMGWHNFYRSEQWDNYGCTVISPIFLLFNNDDELHGFGIPMRGNFSAKAFEHPGAAAIAVLAGKSDGTYPVCSTEMANRYVVGTVHVFFIERGDQFSCPWSSYYGVVKSLYSYEGNQVSSMWSAIKNFRWCSLWQSCTDDSEESDDSSS